MTRVVITGYGGICSLGNDTTRIWNNIVEKKLGYSKDEYSLPGIKSKFFGRIVDPLDTRSISRRILRNTPRFAQLALLAAQEAMSMTFPQEGISSVYRDVDCGTIVGTGWGGIDSISANATLRKMEEMPTQACFHSMPNIATAAVSVNWGLRGYQNTPVAACATSNIAIGDAYRLIKNGVVKFMIAGGAESTMDPFSIWAIDVMGALSKESDDPAAACCPFDARRSGFILSEGAALVCLERLEDALARGATILGEIIGYDSRSDAWSTLSAPAPDLTGRIEAVQRAMDDAGVSTDDIGYINAHGTSTQANDLSETVTIKRIFGKKAYNIPISSTKSYTGHLIAAAGAMETIFCLKAMQYGMAPATVNLIEPDPDCDLNYLACDHLSEISIQTVLNVNYGFGGANSCLVLRGY